MNGVIGYGTQSFTIIMYTAPANPLRSFKSVILLDRALGDMLSIRIQIKVQTA